MLTVAEMLGRDLLRRRLALALLILLPLGFYLASRGSDGRDALASGGIGMSWTIAGASLFAALGARAADPRLVLDGYRPVQLLVGRMLFLWTYGLVVAAGFGVLMQAASSPTRPLDLYLGLVLVAAVAVPLGLSIAALIPRELEGTLLIIAFIGIPLSLGADSGMAGWLPLGGAQRLLRAASGELFNSHQAEARAVGWALVLSVVAAVAFMWRLSGRPRLIRFGAVGAVGLALMAVPASAASIPARDRSIVAVPVGRDPIRLAAGPKDLWVSNFDDRTLSSINPATATVERTITLSARPLGLAEDADGGTVWVTEPDVGRVEEVMDGGFVAPLDVGGEPVDAAVVDHVPWVVDTRAGTLDRIDPASRTVTARVAVGHAPIWVASASGTLWVGSVHDQSVTRVDPVTARVLATVPLHLRAVAAAGDQEGLWLMCPEDHLVARLDGTFLQVTSRFGVSPVRAIASVQGQPWAVVGHVVFSPQGRAISIGRATASAMVAADGDLWVTDALTNSVLRVKMVP